ncbi:hypothetical protein FRB95_006417 [Tulasnella sp. JGI-2019a]|nr:hypothetical protein FRB95_006417 [Tulasnella sp. JGI-2019a]
MFDYTMNSTGVPLDALSAIIPGTTIPNSAQPAFFLGFIVVLFCNFSTTYNHPVLPYLRLASAVPAYYACWLYGFSGRFQLLNRSVALGMALLGTYGGLKVTEICVVGFWNKEGDWPKWIRLRSQQERKAGLSKKEKQKGMRGMGNVVQFEPTLFGRLVYAHDLGSASGSSWIAGRVWDWAPASMRNQDPTPKSRWEFGFTSLRKLVECYLVVDVCESILSTRDWDFYTPNARPVTAAGIPLAWQFVYSLCVCVRTAMDITFPFLVFGLASSLLANTPSTAFAPLFDAPFTSASLAEFWSVRWHPIFRRSFDRISAGVLSFTICISGGSFTKQSRGAKVLRSIIIFTLSCTEHLILFSALPTDAQYPAQPFLDT